MQDTLILTQVQYFAVLKWLDSDVIILCSIRQQMIESRIEGRVKKSKLLLHSHSSSTIVGPEETRLRLESVWTTRLSESWKYRENRGFFHLKAPLVETTTCVIVSVSSHRVQRCLPREKDPSTSTILLERQIYLAEVLWNGCLMVKFSFDIVRAFVTYTESFWQPISSFAYQIGTQYAARRDQLSKTVVGDRVRLWRDENLLSKLAVPLQKTGGEFPQRRITHAATRTYGPRAHWRMLCIQH